jgi:hypothetical protein
MNKVKYAFIGDIHSQINPLAKALEVCAANGSTPIFLGDLFDSRMETSDSAAVYNTVRHVQDNWKYGKPVILRSNHHRKLERYAVTGQVNLGEGFSRTLDDFYQAGIDPLEVASWLQTMPYGVAIKDSKGQEYRAAHAMFPSWLPVSFSDEDQQLVEIYNVNRKARDYMIYGPQIPGAVWPRENTRVYWWEDDHNPNRPWIRVAGHYHVVHISDKSLVLDGNMGGTVDGPEEEATQLCMYDVELQRLYHFDP